MNRIIPRVFREHPIASVALLVIMALVVFVVRNLLGSDRDPRFLAIRAAGYPVTLTELDAYYPAVPAERNAALKYQEAFATPLFTNLTLEDFTPKDDLERAQPLAPEYRTALGDLRATNAAAWDLLYAAAALEGSRYPLDLREGHMVLLPHLAKIKTATTLLCFEGLAHASTANPDHSFAAFAAALHAGGSMRNEPILISYLVRIACSAIAAKRLEQALNLVAFDETQLRALQARFSALDEREAAARALAGERAFGLSVFIDRRMQQSTLQPPPGQNLGPGPFPSGVAGRFFFSAYKASGLMARDRKAFLDGMGTNIAFAELESAARVRAGPIPSMVPTNRFLIFSRMLLPAHQRVLDRANEHSARMRVTATALAVERFRLANGGALPATLAELSPKFIDTVPLDPFDSQSLRLKRLPRGFTVYSIGQDRQDDGGAEAPASRDRGRTRTMPKDLTFTIERD